ncbi:MAG: hypothetical protein HC783_10915 [Rhodobacteraceae bacterium]|nr:hypothetical protein [Paracoccaceae bacterium]
MTRTALAAAFTLMLALPAAAQSLSVLLPVISFPDTVASPSTKGCTADSASTVCTLQE